VGGLDYGCKVERSSTICSSRSSDVDPNDLRFRSVARRLRTRREPTTPRLLSSHMRAIGPFLLNESVVNWITHQTRIAEAKHESGLLVHP